VNTIALKVMDAGIVFKTLSSFDPGRLIIDGSSVADGGPAAAIRLPSGAERIHASQMLVVPGFIEPHIHGCGGVDVMEGTYDALNVVSRIVARHGTTGFLATTVSSPLPTLTAALERLGGLTSKTFDGAQLLGVHLEGPFINSVQ